MMRGHSGPGSARGVLRRGAWLLVIEHGVGDAVMATTVLLHLAAAGVVVDVWCRRGVTTLFHRLCRRAYAFDEPRPNENDYARVYRLPFWEPNECYADSPATKAEVMLRHLLGMRPNEALCRYEVWPSEEATERAAERMRELAGEQPIALLHYQGASGAAVKDLPEPVIAEVCRWCDGAGLAPVVLDEFGTSQAVRRGLAAGLTGRDRLWRGQGLDAGIVAALARRAAVCLGIDSGPGHIFAARNVETPTAIVWPSHVLHPLHYFAPAEHVVHVVPSDHAEGIHGDRAVGLSYFARRYRSHVCRRHFREEVVGVLEASVRAGAGSTGMDHKSAVWCQGKG